MHSATDQATLPVVPNEGSRATKPATVLVVEDNWITCEIVRSALSSRGHAVLLAATGRAAVETFAGQPFQLVLLDLMLPDADGAVLLETLRRMPGGEDIPILAFSAFVARMEDLRQQGAHFDDYIAKPIEPSDLIRIVEEHLGRACRNQNPRLHTL